MKREFATREMRGIVAAFVQLHQEAIREGSYQVGKMLVTVDSFATPRALWHTDPAFRIRVISEWDKIEPYLAKGFIAEWPTAQAAQSETDTSKVSKVIDTRQ